MRKCSLVLLLLLAVLIAHAQPNQNKPEKVNPDQKDYQWRIKQEKLFGVYIPRDLPECFAQLTKLSDDASIAKFKAMPENEASTRLFFSVGRWLSVNYAFYEGSRFSVYLNEMGISSPDDKIHFVLTTWHRHLNGKDLGVKELVLAYKDKQRKSVEKKHSKATIISTEKKLVKKQ